MQEARRFRILSSIILLFGSISLNAQTEGVGISISNWPIQIQSSRFEYHMQTLIPKESSVLKSPTLILPDNMATSFFCRMEVKAEKASKIPVLFRLGSVDHVERMEGKRKDMFIR